jgi:IPT/TIG domain
VHAWRWICGVKPKPKAGNKPSPPSIGHGLDKPGVFTTVSEIVIQVPDVPAGFYNVTVTTNGVQSNAVPFLVEGKPVIDELEPYWGPIGSVVTIRGSNFGATPGQVTFGGTPTTIVSWSESAVQVTVPSVPLPTLLVPDTALVKVTTTLGRQSNTLRFDPRTTQDFLKLAVDAARAALRVQGNTNPTPVELSREGFQEAIRFREWCKNNFDNTRPEFPEPEGDACVRNPYARDAEYFLRGYEGGALYSSPGEIRLTANLVADRNEIANLLGSPITAFRTLLKGLLQPFLEHISDLEGISANVAGYNAGLIGIPLDTAIDQYVDTHGIPLFPMFPTDEVILPDGRIIHIQLDELGTGTTGDFSIFKGAVEAIQTYFFDPPAADVYLFAVSGDTHIQSVVIPEQGLTARTYVLEVGDQRFNVQVGEVFDFLQHGFANGVDGFAILDFDIPNTHELVTGFTFTQNSNIFLSEVSLHLDTLPPTPTASASPPPNATGWNNTAVTVTLSATDNPSGSGVKQLQFSLAGVSSGMQTVTGNSAAVAITNEGVTTLTYFATDNPGNQEAPKTFTVRIDTAPPMITVAATPTSLWPPNGKMAPVTISGTATYTVTDEYGGVQPSGKVTLGSNGSYSFTIQLQSSRNGNDKDGRQYIITVSAQDNAGNKRSAATGVTVPHDQGH